MALSSRLVRIVAVLLVWLLIESEIEGEELAVVEMGAFSVLNFVHDSVKDS